MSNRRKQNVFEDRKLRQQMMFLKDEADVLVAKLSKMLFIKAKRILPLDLHSSVGRLVKRPDDVKERAFTRSAGPENGSVFRLDQA